MTSVMDSNYWDLRQPQEAIRKKRAKQAQRRSAKKEGRDETVPVHSASEGSITDDEAAPAHSDHDVAEPARMEQREQT